MVRLATLFANNKVTRTSTKFSYAVGFLSLLFTFFIITYTLISGSFNKEVITLVDSFLIFIASMFSVNVSRIAVENVNKNKSDKKEKE